MILLSGSAFQPLLNPVSHSAALSALVAASPLVVLFVLLGVVRWKAHRAALAALACAMAVACIGFEMPLGTAADSVLVGAAFGLFPIMWIVVNAIWIYNMTVATGHFDALRRSMGSISPDLRVQAVVIAFCFGGLLEALAGFGTPVAITAAMLIAVGMQPLKAASAALVANTAPVAFGAMASPITTLAALTHLPVHDVSMMVGRQTPLLALIVPLLLVAIVDGTRGLRQAWLPAIVVGVVFAVAQFGASNYLSAQLTDVVASLAGTAALVLLLRVWRPTTMVAAKSATDDKNAANEELQFQVERAALLAHEVEAGGARRSVSLAAHPASAQDTGSRASDTVRAYAPYAVIIAVFSLAQIPAVKQLLAKATVTFAWPGLHVLTATGAPASSTTFRFDWLASAGSLLLLCGLVVVPVLGLEPRAALRAYGHTVRQLRVAILTVACVLGLAYLMNLSGQTTAIGHWLAGAGRAFAFLSPVLGWLGVAVTGSDTSANALFGSMQVAAATDAGLPPLLLAAANSSGGVIGKMISPQNLAIAAAVTGLHGREGDLLRKVIGWGVGLLLALCVLVFLQSNSALGWMVP
ncbi:L-lactate permease [Streptomyces sp. NPDC004546]|uniref:L-lactate permease n=1 Tax=unclassified Streptomyces TaxID=2593676 RepID=UPI0033BB45DB